MTSNQAQPFEIDEEELEETTGVDELDEEFFDLTEDEEDNEEDEDDEDDTLFDLTEDEDDEDEDDETFDLTEDEDDEDEEYDLYDDEEEEDEETFDLTENEEDEDAVFDLTEDEEEDPYFDLAEDENEELYYNLTEDEEEATEDTLFDLTEEDEVEELEEELEEDEYQAQQGYEPTYEDTEEDDYHSHAGKYDFTETTSDFNPSQEVPVQGFTDSGFLNLSSDAFHIVPAQELAINQIAFSEPTKTSRKATIAGLTKTVADMGVLNSIHVLQLEQLDEDTLAILEEEGEELPPQYLLIDGLRRTFAALKNKHQTIPANVWVFKDVELGKKLAFELGVWLNRTQKHAWSEIWDTYQLLESRSQLRPAMFEFLFQLQAGDALKLKEVMLGEYNEPKEQLLAEEKSLEQCYKALMKLRKEEDDLEKADNTGFGDTSEDAAQITEEVQSASLTDEETKEMLEIGNNQDLLDVSDEDFHEMNEDIVTVQTPGQRTRTDPRVRKAVLLRDGFVCQTCGTGGPAFMDVVVVHHKWLVQFGGPDSIENCITLCDTCHLTLHVIQYNEGRLAMTQEQFNEYSDEQQTRIKRILKLGRYAYQTSKKSGLSTDEIQAIAKTHAYAHRKPGENQEENMSAYMDWRKDKSKATDYTNAAARLGKVGKGEAKRLTQTQSSQE